jgi:hypothetical protein
MFALNSQQDAELSLTLLYSELPSYYTWSLPQRRWNARSTRTRGTIGRLVEVAAQRTEPFYLRMLLQHVRGPRNYEHLRTVNGQLYDTFKEACVALQLLKDDAYLVNCLQEAANSRVPAALRKFFAHLIIYCDVTDSTTLFNRFQNDLCADLLNRGMSEANARASTLASIARIVLTISGRNLSEEEDHTALFIQQVELNVEDIFEMDEPHRQQEDVQPQVDDLNHEQRVVYDEVMECILNQEGTIVRGREHLFFVNGPGGSGKSFLYQTIIGTLMQRGLPYTCIAWTGIAALLLDGGTTAHYSLGLPLNMNCDSTSSIKKNDRKADLLRNASIILWDEAPMAHKQSLKILDKLLKFLMNNQLPFGGKLILLGGDFRQLLPVVPNVSQAQVAMASICQSELWPQFQRFYLTQNHRAGPNELEFARYLETVGDGKHASVPGRHECCMKIPSFCVTNKANLISSTFGDDPCQTCPSRAILCPTNAAVSHINEEVLKRVNGELHRILSADVVADSNKEDIYFPQEVMHALTPTGLPPHELKLKVGSPVMCLRNLDLSAGLCNGTRLQVLEVNKNVLRCTILNGRNKGDIAFIPRIDLKAPDSGTPLPFTRNQFPVRLSYSLTISKSQGQTFDKIGLYLERPVFSHGQIYVAFSRVRKLEDLKVCVVHDGIQGRFGNDTVTSNIVNQVIIQKTRRS